MQTNSSTNALIAAKRPWWLLLSFGAALLLFAGAAAFFGAIIHDGLKDMIDNLGTMDREFWSGFVRVVGYSLMLLALAAAFVTEIRAVFKPTIAGAAYQAKLWRQARRVMLYCMGLVVLSSCFVTFVPGRSQLFEISLIGAFLLLCFVSSTHAKWSSSLQ
jgi:hypothetical protein